MHSSSYIDLAATILLRFESSYRDWHALKDKCTGVVFRQQAQLATCCSTTILPADRLDWACQAWHQPQPQQCLATEFARCAVNHTCWQSHWHALWACECAVHVGWWLRAGRTSASAPGPAAWPACADAGQHTANNSADNCMCVFSDHELL